jgi:phospholipase/carboxylesterase
MDAETHEGNGLPYVTMKPVGSNGAGLPLVILLHGFGASMYDLPSLGPAIDSANYIYAFPNAPYRLDFGGGQYGYSWAMRENVEPPPPDMPPVDNLIEAFIADVMEKTDTEAGKVVLGGFSQGGGITLHYGLPRPDIFAGLIVLSGSFRDPDNAQLPERRDQRIFVAHGTQDQVVTIDRGGRATKAFLEGAGYAPAYREYDMAHEIPPSVVRDLALWLHETLPVAQRA